MPQEPTDDQLIRSTKREGHSFNTATETKESLSAIMSMRQQITRSLRTGSAACPGDRLNILGGEGGLRSADECWGYSDRGLEFASIFSKHMKHS